MALDLSQLKSIYLNRTDLRLESATEWVVFHISHNESKKLERLCEAHPPQEDTGLNNEVLVLLDQIITRHCGETNLPDWMRRVER